MLRLKPSQWCKPHSNAKSANISILNTSRLTKLISSIKHEVLKDSLLFKEIGQLLKYAAPFARKKRLKQNISTAFKYSLLSADNRRSSKQLKWPFSWPISCQSFNVAQTSIEISPQPVTFKTKTYYMSFQAPTRGIECLTDFTGNRVIHKRCAGAKRHTQTYKSRGGIWYSLSVIRRTEQR